MPNDHLYSGVRQFVGISYPDTNQRYELKTKTNHPAKNPLSPIAQMLSAMLHGGVFIKKELKNSDLFCSRPPLGRRFTILFQELGGEIGRRGEARPVSNFGNG
jgi:hypothetical protein